MTASPTARFEGGPQNGLLTGREREDLRCVLAILTGNMPIVAVARRHSRMLFHRGGGVVEDGWPRIFIGGARRVSIVRE